MKSAQVGQAERGAGILKDQTTAGSCGFSFGIGSFRKRRGRPLFYTKREEHHVMKRLSS